MKIKQVVVVTKLKPQDLRDETRHDHKETLQKVKKFLDSLPLRYRIIDRNHLHQTISADLILTVGGDGTTLAASHFTDHAPLLGINSAPKTSTGFFSLARPHNFQKIIEEILDGKRKPKKIPRLEVIIDGEKFPYPGLNEMLLASRLQGDTARYRLSIGHQEEEQKSSGVWIATGAGSTAVIRSAGGKQDSPFSQRLQYRVREPFCFPKKHYHLLHGFLKPGQSLKLVSHMHQGMIFVDGAKLHARVRKNAEIIVRGGLSPVKLFL